MFEQLFRSVADAQVADLGDDALLGHINACERLKTRVEGLQAEALVEFSRRRAAEVAGQPAYANVAHASAVSEVAAACHWSDGGAARRMVLAERLSEHPRVFDALTRGDLDTGKARLVLDAVDALATVARTADGGHDAKAAAKDAAAMASDRLQALAIEAGPGLTWSQLGAKLRTWTATLAPGITEAARVRTDANRKVNLHPMQDGQAGMWLAGPELAVATLYARADAEARHLRRAPGETRTLDQLRFDVLTGLTHTPLPGTADPGTGTVRPSPVKVEVGVMVPASTLLTVPTLPGVPTQPGAGAGGGFERPGQVTGLGRTGDGAITPDLTRLIATGRSALGADLTFRRYLTHPLTGNLLHTDTSTYRPSAATARTVAAIHPHCTMPGCTVPAASCELDHATPHNSGGTTCWCNLQPLCKRHHLVKTHGVWTATITPAGHTIWTTPTGHTRVVLIPPLDPDPPLAPAPTIPATYAHESDPPPF